MTYLLILKVVFLRNIPPYTGGAGIEYYIVFTYIIKLRELKLLLEIKKVK